MNQIDLLVMNSLAGLAHGFDKPATCSDETVDCSLVIPFGEVAFFKERAWKPSNWYRRARDVSRQAHPGLSLSSKTRQVAFGTSSLKGKDLSDPANFLVQQHDCKLLSIPTLFLLKYSAPLGVHDVDHSKTFKEAISQQMQKKLQQRLLYA